MAIEDDIAAYNAGLRDITSQTVVALNEISTATTKSKSYMIELAQTTKSMAASDAQLVSSLRQANTLSKSQAKTLTSQLATSRGLKAARVAEMNVSKQQRSIAEQHVKILKSGGPLSAMKGNMMQLNQQAKEWKNVGRDLARLNIGKAVETSFDKVSDYGLKFGTLMGGLWTKGTETTLDLIEGILGKKMGDIAKASLKLLEFINVRKIENAKYRLAAAAGGGITGPESKRNLSGQYKQRIEVGRQWGMSAEKFMEEIVKTAATGRFNVATKDIIGFEQSIQGLAGATGQSADAVRQRLGTLMLAYQSSGETAQDAAKRYSVLANAGKKAHAAGLGNMEDIIGEVFGLIDAFKELNLDILGLNW